MIVNPNFFAVDFFYYSNDITFNVFDSFCGGAHIIYKYWPKDS